MACKSLIINGRDTMVIMGCDTSNREVANKVGASHNTVEAVRNQPVQNGQIDQNEQTIERAKAMLREDPGLTVRALSDKVDCSLGTAHKAQKLVAAETTPELTSEPEPKFEPKLIDTEKLMGKAREHFRMQVVARMFLKWKKQYAEGIGGIYAMREIIVSVLPLCFPDEDESDEDPPPSAA
jgi:hypothetical protein